MIVHAIAGLPRSGSTLLCNILNQNEKAHATSTSCLPAFVRGMVQNSNSIEFKNLLNIDSESAQKRIHNSVKGFTDNWLSHEGKEIVYDKSRGWTDQDTVFKQLYPDGKIIVCVRDLRSVFASVIKQDRVNGLLGGTSPVIAKYNDCFSDDGMIGYVANAVTNLILTQPDNIVFLKFESFVENPKGTMDALYDLLGLEQFQHDFNNVSNTSYDCDGFYLNKFPHKGCGAIKPVRYDFIKYVPKDCCIDIMHKYKIYNEFFGYIALED